MGVSSHCIFSILTVSQFSENRKAGKAVQLTLAVTAQRASLLGSWACLLFTLIAIPVCLVLFSISPLNILEDGCECDACNKFFKKTIVVTLEPRNLNPFKPHCIHLAEASLGEMLNQSQLAEPLILTSASSGWGQMKRQIPHMHHSLQREAHWTVPLSLNASAVWMNQLPGVSGRSAHLLWVLSGTSQAPACFASIIIYQATTKEEGSALAPGCVK